jgi:hypothetical protein
MTQAARSNLQLRRPPYGDNGFLEDYTAQVPRRAHRLAVLVTSNAAGQTQHTAANYRPRSSLLLNPATGREVRRHPLCRVLPHQRSSETNAP